MSNTKEEFYKLDKILEYDCQYYVIFGERSNGKTFAFLERVLERWWHHGEQGAYVRRWKEDYRGKRGEQLFSGLEEKDIISTITDGEYNRVKYYAGKWYLANYDYDLDKLVTQDEPFCFAFALSDMEHDKSTSYPKITSIGFDEFLTRNYYLPNEFVTFMNVLSTIIRRRNNVKIFMMGNTVNKYCPYFKEMGLRHVNNMEPGKIDIYTYGNSKLKVAVEYTLPQATKGKESDIYFAFDNPSLQMITGGAWEISLYPHCPMKFDRTDILTVFFICFNDELLQCEVVCVDSSAFIYIHRKTSPIRDEDNDIIFSEDYDPRPNHFRNIRKSTSPFVKKISKFFVDDKVFYQDNEVGEVVRNYLQYCVTDKR